MPELKPDHTLDGRYRLIRIIGGGTFGTVWCAEHLALCSLVAIKVLDKAVAKTPELRERFIREAWAAAALRSPHVVQILDCGVDAGSAYIVMELLEGESLEDRLLRSRRLDVTQTARVLRHVGRAIDRAHSAGIVHRDLKPANIFIQSNDGDEVIKVLDFGIAKASRAIFPPGLSGSTPVGVVLGTPHYMSPEQVRGVAELDARADIWSLGVITFECLVGRAAFDGPDIASVLAAILRLKPPVPSALGDVPSGFDEWFERACATDPTHRFESGKHAATEFARLCQITDPGVESRGTKHLAANAEPELPVVRPVRSKTLPWPALQDGAGSKPSPRRPSTGPRLRLLVALGASILVLTWLIGSFVGGPPPNTAAATQSSPRLETHDVSGQRAPETVVSPLPSEAISVPDEPPSGTPLAPSALDASAPRIEVAPAPASRAPRRAASTPAASANQGAKFRRRDTSAPKPKPKPSQAAPGCDPPWSFDEGGRARAKPECI